MALFKVSEKDQKKEAWCEAVFGKKANFPREFTEAQLSRITTDLLMNHDRLIRENAELVRNTQDEVVKQRRIGMIRMYYYDGMLRLEPFCDSEQLAIINEAEEIVKTFEI